MRNKSKFEIILVITVLLVISPWLMIMILDGENVQKFNVFKYFVTLFNSAVRTNMDFFQNDKVVYLDEAIDEEVIDKVKSPFSGGNCDIKESKVEIDDDRRSYVTLKCDDYLIEHVDPNYLDNIEFYEVGKWNKDGKKSYEKKTLYNCVVNNKNIFSDYMEEDYFLYKINKKYNKTYGSIDEISKNNCKVVSMNFYRNKKELYDKSN